MFISPNDIYFYLGDTPFAERFERFNGKDIMKFCYQMAHQCKLWRVPIPNFKKLFTKVFDDICKDQDLFFEDNEREIRNLFTESNQGVLSKGDII